MPDSIDPTKVQWDSEPINPSKVKWDTPTLKADEVVWDDDVQSELDIQEFEQEAIEEGVKEPPPELYNEPPKWAEGGGIGTDIYAGLGAAKETLMPIVEGIAWGAGDIAKLAGPVGAGVSGAAYMATANLTKQAEIGLGTSPPETVEQMLKREATDFAVGSTAGPVLSAVGRGTVIGAKAVGKVIKTGVSKIIGKGIPKKEIIKELAVKEKVKELTKLLETGLKGEGTQLELPFSKIEIIQMELDLMKKGVKPLSIVPKTSIKETGGLLPSTVENYGENLRRTFRDKATTEKFSVEAFDKFYNKAIATGETSIQAAYTAYGKAIKNLGVVAKGPGVNIGSFLIETKDLTKKEFQNKVKELSTSPKTKKLLLKLHDVSQSLKAKTESSGKEITEQLDLSLIGRKLKQPKTGMLTGKRAVLYNIDKEAYQKSLMLDVPSYAEPSLPFTKTSNISKEQYFDSIVKGFANMTDDLIKAENVTVASSKSIGQAVAKNEPTIEKVLKDGFDYYNNNGGKKYKGDVGMFGSLLKHTQSYSIMSKVHSISRQIAGKGRWLGIRKLGFKVAFTKRLDRYGRGLSRKEWGEVENLLNSYHTISDVPQEVKKSTSLNVLYSFDKIRKEILTPIARIHKIGTEGKPEFLYEYFTRLYKDIETLSPKEQKQVIFNFASENRITYEMAEKLFTRPQELFKVVKGIGKEGFFGPLSKERTLAVESEALKGLKFKPREALELYIKGAADKWARDKFLPFAREAVKEIPENSAIRGITEHYIRRYQGAPGFESAFWQNFPRFNNVLVKVSRFEAMKQFTSKIALNWSPLIWNTTQYPLNDGTKAIEKAIKGRTSGPLVDFARAMVGLITKRGRAVSKKIGLDVGQAEIPIRDIHGFMEKTAHLAGTMFRVSEQNNKTMSRLRVYDDIYKSLDKSLSIGEKRQLAGELSAELIDETQFLVGVTGTPEILQGPVLGTLGRFKIFPLRTIEYFRNLTTMEKLIYVGLLDLAGGPRTIPGIRQLHFEMRLKYPDDVFTKMLDTFQDVSITGGINAVTDYDIDLGRHIGLGFLPGVSLDEPWWTGWVDNTYAKVGEVLEGPTVSGIRNLYKDISSGNLDPRDKGMAEFFNTPSINEIGVGIKKTARMFEELENKFVKASRGRKGAELKDDMTVYLRAFGLDTIETVDQTRALRYKERQIEKENIKKNELTDRRIRLEEMLRGSKTLEERMEVIKKIGSNIKEMGDYNREHRSNPITTKTVGEAYKNKQRSLIDRVMGNKAQEYELRQDIERLKQDKERGR